MCREQTLTLSTALYRIVSTVHLESTWFNLDSLSYSLKVKVTKVLRRTETAASQLVILLRSGFPAFLLSHNTWYNFLLVRK
jgi:hypothetical protein